MSKNPKEKPLSTYREDGRMKKKAEIADESIQGTNDSSIASKRSVESLYRERGSNDPEFFKFFVPKRQRRSPNINRGYWTRMESMKNAVRKFEHCEFSGKKVVVNLGCGFDPLAFQHIYHNPETELVFIDVDYPDLMRRKLNIINHYPELSELLRDKDSLEKGGHVMLKSRNYIAMSCDLRNLDQFSTLLNGLSPFETSAFLFIAEVSLTYMVQESADKLIQWAGEKLPYAQFALLEQIIPASENHPFAKRMLNHFQSYGSPLNSVELYPTLDDQIQRFKTRKWDHVQAMDLTEFWKDIVTTEQKQFVRSVEDFDEWEEFYIFGQHYFILEAVNGLKYDQITDNTTILEDIGVSERRFKQTQLTVPSDTEFRRKYSAGCKDNSSSLIMHGGMGEHRKQNSVSLAAGESVVFEDIREIPARMCHTLTCLTTGDLLLIGGRTSPSKPLYDCWVFSTENEKWEKVHDLPEPRYRHCTVALPNGKALVYGGSDSFDWLVWSRQNGWEKIEADIPPRWSACLNWNIAKGDGVLIGGLDDSTTGAISNEALVVEFDEQTSKISGKPLTKSVFLARIGAKSVSLDENTLLVAGGASDKLLYGYYDLLIELDVTTGTIKKVPISTQMLLTGFNMDRVNSSLMIYGGGAVCYSFGSHWNGVWELSLDGDHDKLVEAYI